MRIIARGYIYWAELKGEGSVQAGKRPVLVVSNNKGNFNSSIVVVVPLTTQEKKPLPTHVSIEESNCKGIFLCEQVVTISQSQLRDFITIASQDQMLRIDLALVAALDLDGKYSKYQRTEDVKKTKPAYDAVAIDKQIALCKEIQNTMQVQVRRLEQLLNQPSPGLKAWETAKVVKQTAQNSGSKRTYTRRTVEETQQIIKDYENGSNLTDVAKVYGFSSKTMLHQFYCRWKDRIHKEVCNG